MQLRLLPLFPLALILAGCGATGTGVSSASGTAATTRVRLPSHSGPPYAQIQSLPGLEGVIGADRTQLIRQFGQPRLDVIEGDARKLQFSATPCVLDVYLYPPAPGREPQATYVDARRASDGRDVNRAACVAALRGLAGRNR